jgi:hypothetical protein
LDDEENELRCVGLYQHFDRWGVPYKEVVGMYNGRTERSFVVRNHATARLVGILYNQSSYLYVQNGHAWEVLVLTGEETYIGRFESTETPEKYESHTYDPETGVYYVARKEEAA